MYRLFSLLMLTFIITGCGRLSENNSSLNNDLRPSLSSSEIASNIEISNIKIVPYVNPKTGSPTQMVLCDIKNNNSFEVDNIIVEMKVKHTDTTKVYERNIYSSEDHNGELIQPGATYSLTTDDGIVIMNTDMLGNATKVEMKPIRAYAKGQYKREQVKKTAEMEIPKDAYATSAPASRIHEVQCTTTQDMSKIEGNASELMPSVPENSVQISLGQPQYEAGDYATAFSNIEMPLTSPVGVALRKCTFEGKRYSYTFAIRNNSGRKWNGQVRIWLLDSNGKALTYSDFGGKMSPGTTSYCSFSRKIGPQLFGGNATAYGWASASTPTTQ